MRLAFEYVSNICMKVARYQYSKYYITQILKLQMFSDDLNFEFLSLSYSLILYIYIIAVPDQDGHILII